MIHHYEFDFFGKQIHNYGSQLVIHRYEIDFFGKQIHKYGPQIVIHSRDLNIFVANKFINVDHKL